MVFRCWFLPPSENKTVSEEAKYLLVVGEINTEMLHLRFQSHDFEILGMAFRFSFDFFHHRKTKPFLRKLEICDGGRNQNRNALPDISIHSHDFEILGMAFRFWFLPPSENETVSEKAKYLSVVGEIKTEMLYLRFQSHDFEILGMAFGFDFSHHWETKLFLRKLNICQWWEKSKPKGFT